MNQNPRRHANLIMLDRRRLAYRLRLSLPSTKGAVKRAVARVRRLAALCGCTDEQRTDLEIALFEALANAMEHGNDGNSRRRILLRCYGGPHAGIVILVRDQGPGFDPEAVPDPRRSEGRQLHHGRGLLLMRELMDVVEYRRGGREVLMVRNCRAG